MIDFSTAQFAEMKARAAERAAEILAQSYDGDCPRCGRVTWHYLIAKVNDQQIYRCAGCGCETVTP